MNREEGPKSSPQSPHQFSMKNGHWICGLLPQLSGEGNGTPLQYPCLENPMDGGAWWAAVHGVMKSWTQLSDFTFTFYFHALEKEMATHSSVLAWRIPGMGEPGGLPYMGSHRVGHDWSDLAAAAPIIFAIPFADFISLTVTPLVSDLASLDVGLLWKDVVRSSENTSFSPWGYPCCQRIPLHLLSLADLNLRGCVGEGNGTPLQYSCLENPMDRGAW